MRLSCSSVWFCNRRTAQVEHLRSGHVRQYPTHTYECYRRKNIAIVGGGPGGLTLARLLQHSRAKVSVFERDQSRGARVQGSALDLHEGSGLAALEAAGLMEAFWANHRPDLDRLRLTDASGTVLHDHARRMSGA